MQRLIMVLILIMVSAIQAQNKTIEGKLNLVIPQLKFQDITVKEALSMIQQKSRQFSDDKKGILIILKNQKDKKLNRKITADFTNISVKAAIKYTCLGTGLHYRISQGGTSVLVSSEIAKQLETKFYRVSSIFTSYVSPKNTRLITQEKLKDFFTSTGVPFPKGAKVSYLAGKNLVSMTNTSTNQDKTRKTLLNLGCLR